MTHSPGRCFLVFFAIASFGLSGALLEAEEKSGESLPLLSVSAAGLDLSEGIRIDGSLDEAAWSRAGVITGLTQQAPHPGEKSSFLTEVRLLVDAENLFVGIVCTDPDPGKIAIHTMQRDGDMEGDDTVAVTIDTFGDHRTGYVFRVNAGGARQDGLLAGVDNLSLDWDGIWDAAVRRTATGWSAEIAIPSRTLRFPPGIDRWGFNVERVVARRQTTFRWCATTLDSSFSDLSRAGLLEGVGGLTQGLGFSVSPFALGKWTANHETGERHARGDAGGDVTYNLTPELTGVLSLNTDFAETEVDTRQINLTRFPLFYPEKRTFFLEGANLFDFGAPFRAFYSRRIGLFEENKIPIDGGVKLLGRAGPWGIALLDVETGSSKFAPGTNLFASRVTYDATGDLKIGAIVTAGNPDGIRDNRFAGFDAQWRTSTFQGDKNLFLGAWTAGSRGDLGKGKRSGWGFLASYPNDLWDLSLGFDLLGGSLDPALGFVDRPGTKTYHAAVAYQPRPSGDDSFSQIRQAYFECDARRVDDLAGNTQTWRVFFAPFNVSTVNGDHFEVNAAPEFERLMVPFEISPGVVIPVGSYNFTRYRIQIESSRHRQWNGGLTVWFGDFFGGRLTQIQNEIGWTSAGGHLHLDVSSENDVGHLPEGDFIERLWQLKGVYAFTPEAVLSLLAQYDSESRTVGANARFRWTIRPGNDLFIVWDHGWRHPVQEGSIALEPLSDQIAMKVRWTFRP